jgi:hypothetical protein
MKNYLVKENGMAWLPATTSYDGAMVEFTRRKDNCNCVTLEENDNGKINIIEIYKGKYYTFIEKAIDNMYDICGGSIVVELGNFTISLVDTGNKIIQLNIYKKGYESSYDFDWNGIKNTKDMISDMAKRLSSNIKAYYEIKMYKQIEKVNREIEQWSKTK